MTTAADIAQRLNAKKTADGWIAKCPVHADSSPSLSIGQGDNGVLLLHCFAGCAFADILAALNIAPGRAAVAPVARQEPQGYEKPGFDAYKWWRAVRRVCTGEKLQPWADTLGLPLEDLDVMGACTLGETLAFPMHDGTGAVCGIRTRTPDGQKKAVTGSRAGVFLPTFPQPGETVVCEGPTDSTAALAWGFSPIGRPSCAGCERHVIDTCRRLEVKRVTVCADADGPGIVGARKMADLLRAARVAVRLVTPGGHKDLRDWYKTGAIRETVDASWSQAEWRQA